MHGGGGGGGGGGGQSDLAVSYSSFMHFLFTDDKEINYLPTSYLLFFSPAHPPIKFADTSLRMFTHD